MREKERESVCVCVCVCVWSKLCKGLATCPISQEETIFPCHYLKPLSDEGGEETGVLGEDPQQWASENAIY